MPAARCSWCATGSPTCHAPHSGARRLSSSTSDGTSRRCSRGAEGSSAEFSCGPATGNAPRQCCSRRCDVSPDRRRGGGRALPLAALAELRLRQGRLEETEQLLEGLDDERVALAPLVGLQLQRGDLALARALLDRRDSDGDAGVLVLEGSVRSGGGRPRCRVRGRGRVAGARPGARPRRRDRAECAPCRSCRRRARRCCDC